LRAVATLEQSFSIAILSTVTVRSLSTCSWVACWVAQDEAAHEASWFNIVTTQVLVNTLVLKDHLHDVAHQEVRVEGVEISVCKKTKTSVQVIRVPISRFEAVSHASMANQHASIILIWWLILVLVLVHDHEAETVLQTASHEPNIQHVPLLHLMHARLRQNFVVGTHQVIVKPGDIKCVGNDETARPRHNALLLIVDFLFAEGETGAWGCEANFIQGPPGWEADMLVNIGIEFQEVVQVHLIPIVVLSLWHEGL